MPESRTRVRIQQSQAIGDQGRKTTTQQAYDTRLDSPSSNPSGPGRKIIAVSPKDMIGSLNSLCGEAGTSVVSAGVLIYWLNFWPLEPPLCDLTTHSNNPLDDKISGGAHSSVGTAQRSSGARYRDALPVGVVVCLGEIEKRKPKVEHGFFTPIPYKRMHFSTTTKPVLKGIFGYWFHLASFILRSFASARLVVAREAATRLVCHRSQHEWMDRKPNDLRSAMVVGIMSSMRMPLRYSRIPMVD